MCFFYVGQAVPQGFKAFRLKGKKDNQKPPPSPPKKKDCVYTNWTAQAAFMYQKKVYRQKHLAWVFHPHVEFLCDNIWRGNVNKFIFSCSNFINFT